MSCSTCTIRPYELPSVVQAFADPAVALASTLSVPQRLHVDVGKPIPQRPTETPAASNCVASAVVKPEVGDAPDPSLTSASGHAEPLPWSCRKRSAGLPESEA